jgi:hypothetical protein
MRRPLVAGMVLALAGAAVALIATPAAAADNSSGVTVGAGEIVGPGEAPDGTPERPYGGTVRDLEQADLDVDVRIEIGRCRCSVLVPYDP